MVYTVTLNPSLDYITTVNHFTPGAVNRAGNEQLRPGGKGINVSIMLKNLGMESTILGFIAGFIGLEIRRQLTTMGYNEHLSLLPEGNSRINLKLCFHEGDSQPTGYPNQMNDVISEINGKGPFIDGRSFWAFCLNRNHFRKGDVLVLAGSVPDSLDSHAYREILEVVEKEEILTVVDATRDLLCNTLPCHPFLIKPNIHELGDLFGVTLTSQAEVIPYATELQAQGAKNVLVSMGGEGAVLVTDTGAVYTCPAPKGNVMNPVGAGDSMVAGFLYSYLSTGDYQAALRMGVAAGSASAFSEWLATRTQVDRLLRSMPPLASAIPTIPTTLLPFPPTSVPADTPTA